MPLPLLRRMASSALLWSIARGATRVSTAFTPTSSLARPLLGVGSRTPGHSSLFRPLSSSSPNEYRDSYAFDSDEEVEQRLADEINGSANSSTKPATTITPATTTTTTTTTKGTTYANKYLSVIHDTGLTSQLHSTTLNLPPRTISTNDVFCNREIKLQHIRAIGFDMDYTLAQYNQPEFDKLAFDGAVQKLVHSLGYPEEVLEFTYDNADQFWIRGLIIDTQRGNFLKIDRHKYVRVAYHGFQPMSSKIRKSLYSRAFNKIPSFSEKHFVNLDTLFQHVDAHLFASLVDLKDEGDHEFLDGKTYEELYKDVRACVDLCHRDGVIKDVVAERPGDFIIHDPDLVPMLQSYRDAGVKVFLLTNSHWEYTAVAMNYLFHGKRADEETFKRNEWLELFDIVIVGSCKPAFLVDPYLNLFRVNPLDGGLRNTDGVFEIEALGPNGAEKFLEKGKVFQGGNWLQLQAMMRTQAGEEILYVGDHLYSDVLRSKRTLGWRTTLIVPELTKEMIAFRENRELHHQIIQLRKLRDDMNSYADELKRLPLTPETEKKMMDLEDDDWKVKSVLTTLTDRYHKAFHPVWGQMFVAGYQDSRFAFYVENYACLYTAKASNLGVRSSPERAFRTSAEMLPHDKIISDRTTVLEEFDD